MQLDQFQFIYQDIKAELKQFPPLPLLLKTTEKTTRKLECINLYSIVDKREFDFELYEKDIYTEISHLISRVHQIKAANYNYNQKIEIEQIEQLQGKMWEIKESKIEAFDQLNKEEEEIQAEINRLVNEDELTKEKQQENQIKEVDEYEDEPFEAIVENPPDPIQRLKKEIDLINAKILKINRGKGKWFDGDHNDFIKIYNRCAADAKRIVEEGVKVLGMKNIEILDHLEVYENYLQLEKQKKLATEQFKSIKVAKRDEQVQKRILAKQSEESKAKIKKEMKEEEGRKKKQQIEEFKKKKLEERNKLLENAQLQRQQKKASQKLSVDKRKQIEERNKLMIEQRQEKFKKMARSIEKPEEKAKRQYNINILKEVHTLKQISKPMLPKPKKPNEGEAKLEPKLTK